MTRMEMSEKTKKEQMRRESAQGTWRMPKGQALWGILMLLSLIVMLMAGILAVRAAQNGQGGFTPSYVASGAENEPGGGSFGAGNLVTGKPGAEIASAVKQEMGIFGTDKEAKGNTAQGVALKDGRPIGSAADGGEQDANTAGGGRPIGDAAGSGESGANTPESQGEGGEAQNGGTDENAPVIAMTFDDGPFTKVTNRIIDVLLEYDADATFFVVGSRIDMYSDTLKRIYESGFEVASHTWSHKNLNKLSQEEVLKEIQDTQDKLNAYVPVGSVLLRPPYGSADENVRAAAGTSLINWSLDSEDWKSKNTDKIIQHVLATVQDGDIILMHDLYECTAEAVEYLVPELVARGYQLVSVSELFRRKGVPLEEGILYRNPWDSY